MCLACAPTWLSTLPWLSPPSSHLLLPSSCRRAVAVRPGWPPCSTASTCASAARTACPAPPPTLPRGCGPQTAGCCATASQASARQPLAAGPCPAATCILPESCCASSIRVLWLLLCTPRLLLSLSLSRRCRRGRGAADPGGALLQQPQLRGQRQPRDDCARHTAHNAAAAGRVSAPLEP